MPAEAPLQAKYYDDTTYSSSHRLLYAYQWLVLLLVCPPLLALSILLPLPIALLLWFTGAVNIGRRLAAQRDPVLAKSMEVAEGASLAAFGRVYISLAATGIHHTLRLFACIGKPKTVFVVYLSNSHLMRKLFCVGTSELIRRAGLYKGAM